MTLQIEAGKYYRTRDGRKVGPMWPDDSFSGIAFIEKELDGRGWWPDGTIAGNNDTCETIIAEWVDEPSQPEPLDLAALAKQHGIRITVAVGEMSMTFDGRE